MHLVKSVDSYFGLIIKMTDRPLAMDSYIEHIEDLRNKVDSALDFLWKFNGIDGAHHKQRVLDQVARILAGAHYEEFVKDCKNGIDGPETYDYDEGIAP